jgi:hypothetical protein
LPAEELVTISSRPPVWTISSESRLLSGDEDLSEDDSSKPTFWRRYLWGFKKNRDPARMRQTQSATGSPDNLLQTVGSFSIALS